MNAFQSCRNTSDAVPLYLPQQLYLKPIARINISLQLPRRTMGKTISNWEVMEKLRNLIKPEEFTVLKVTKTSLEFIRFEAEIDSRNKLNYVIDRLNNKLIKLKEFTELMHLRAAEAKSDFPTRHTWDTFFRESKDMDEMKPGERPDTIYISNLPTKWFVPHHLLGDEDLKPSEKIFYRVFEKFGRIRYVDIPICDPYRNKMKNHMTGMQTFSFDENDFFEGYVQFRDYIGFTKAMDAFRNMKLLHKEDGECFIVDIKVDFDRTKHLSDASIRRREIVRERLISKIKEKEEREQKEKEAKEREMQLERERELALKNEKERRRQEREKKRKQKILAKLKINGADEITDKIAKEEKKLIKVQRKLEAIRLVEELFRRIKNKYEKDASSQKIGSSEGDTELNKYKSAYESEVRQQRDKLHKAIEGRVILKSILGGGPHLRSYSSDSLSSESSAEKRNKNENGVRIEQVPVGYSNFEGGYLNWMGYSDAAYPNPFALGSYYPPSIRPPIPGYIPYPSRGRQILGDIAGPSRGLAPPYLRRGRGGYNRFRGINRKRPVYPPELEEEYIKYFRKFLNEHDDRSRRNYSKSRSKSPARYRHSYSRSSSRSRSRSYSHAKSYKRSRSRSRSASNKRYRSSRSYSRSRSRSRSYRSRRSRKSSVSHTPRSNRKSRSRSPLRGRSRSDSQKRSKRKASKSKSREKSRSRRSQSTSKKETSKSRNRSKSVDSTKFISPQHMRNMHSRSKSWSLPRETKRARTRSKSLSPPNKN